MDEEQRVWDVFAADNKKSEIRGALASSLTVFLLWGLVRPRGATFNRIDRMTLTLVLSEEVLWRVAQHQACSLFGFIRNVFCTSKFRCRPLIISLLPSQGCVDLSASRCLRLPDQPSHVAHKSSTMLSLLRHDHDSVLPARSHAYSFDDYLHRSCPKSLPATV